MKLPTDYSKLNFQERRIVREQYVELQEGKCFFCKKTLKLPAIKLKGKSIDWSLFPKNFLQYPVHLQHNHDTGMTEGAVHSYCNAVMWQYHGR